jgi:YVTN family beta-propeller protein
VTAALVLLMAVIAQAAEYAAPAGIQPALRRPGATSILPGGRMISPIGIQYITGPGPLALAASPNGKTILSANRGPERFSLTFLDREKGRRLVRHLVANSQSDDWLGVSTGAVFDGEHTVYVSEGASGRVWAVNPSDGSRKRGFDLNQDGASRSFTGDLAFDPDRKQLYVLDQANSRLAVVDVNRRKVASLPLAGAPQALSLSPDRRRAYITIRSDPGALAIVNLDNPAAPAIVETVRVGVSPSGVLALADRIFVSDAAQDSVLVIDAKTNQVIADVPMRISGLEDLRGLAPIGLAFHPGTGWLLVAEAGANAVGVIDTRKMKLIGHLPVGWVPARILIDGDTVYVSNTRGQGTGPLTGYRPYDENFATIVRRGSISAFPIPAATELGEMTARVMAANGYTPKLMPAPTVIPEAIRHVVLIVKGHRTYDDVLGDIREAGNGAVMGSPVLARFGRNGYADGRNVRLSLQRVDVTPNHHKLAEMFSFSDNFYAEGGIPWASLERHAASFRAQANTSDTLRAEQFIHKIQEKYGEGKEQLPPLVLIQLPNDRLVDPRPEEDFLYDASYVAGNDLALARIVEFLSNSPWWREMAIFVTEEGPPAGLDHIDAYRSILLCVGPYFKKNYASHLNVSFPGLLKTIFRILRLPPAGLLDATASDLADTFSDTPDFTPYTVLPVDPRLSVSAKAAEPEHLLR